MIVGRDQIPNPVNPNDHGNASPNLRVHHRLHASQVEEQTRHSNDDSSPEQVVETRCPQPNTRLAVWRIFRMCLQSRVLHDVVVQFECRETTGYVHIYTIRRVSDLRCRITRITRSCIRMACRSSWSVGIELFSISKTPALIGSEICSQLWMSSNSLGSSGI